MWRTLVVDATALTVQQAAHLLNLSPQRIRALVDSGKLEGERTPLGRLISAESVERLKKERASA